jgi:hypothetical protein
MDRPNIKLNVGLNSNSAHTICRLVKPSMSHLYKATSTSCIQWDKVSNFHRTNKKDPHKWLAHKQKCYSSNQRDINYRHQFLNMIDTRPDSWDNWVPSGTFLVGKINKYLLWVVDHADNLDS